MAAALPKKVAQRREHTGQPAMDRMQLLAQKTATAHEQTKAYVLATQSALAALRSCAAVAMNDANQVMSPAQLARGVIRTSGALTAGRSLSGFPCPSSADGGDWYWYFFWNATTGGFNVTLTDSAGHTLAVGAGGQDAILFMPTGPVILR